MIPILNPKKSHPTVWLGYMLNLVNPVWKDSLQRSYQKFINGHCVERPMAHIRQRSNWHFICTALSSSFGFGSSPCAGRSWAFAVAARGRRPGQTWSKGPTNGMTWMKSSGLLGKLSEPSCMALLTIPKFFAVDSAVVTLEHALVEDLICASAFDTSLCMWIGRLRQTGLSW